MGKCNLLSPISNPTGSFMLFSQYSEDLTKSTSSEDFYRVTPSKYVLLDLEQTEMDSVCVSEFFQNYYENACSIMRQTESFDWTPEYATALVWKALFKSGLAKSPVQDGSDYTYATESLVAIGDIDITSDRQFDGINYSEIYVNIPQGSKRKKYHFYNYSSDQTKAVQWPHPYIDGYPDDQYPTAGDTDWPSNRLDKYGEEDTTFCDGVITVGTEREYTYEIFSRGDYYLEMDPVQELDDSNYSFNAVLVLYDVHKKNLEDPEDITVFRNVPMGIYFTGSIVESEEESETTNHEISNPMTIWVSNPDIYDQGTSYGLRICTRYLSTQNSLYIVDSTVEDVSDMYDQYAAVMAKIGDSQVKMDQILSKVQEYQNNITSHLANVKNYKVNVPYIRNIGGVDYWFVNGNNLGVATTKTTVLWENF